MAPKINTSTASGSEQKPGRYGQLREARVIILADQEAKKARSRRQSTPIPKPSSDSSDSNDSDTTSSCIASVSDSDTTSSTRKARKARSTRGGQARQIPTSSCDSEHARKARSSVIWQHMSQQEVDGRKKTICKYCEKYWFLSGSTSNALRHLKVNHPDRLTKCNVPTTKASGGNHKNIQYKASTAASYAPALANFAMIKANYNPRRYVKILKELYKDNGLQAPDFSKYLS